MVNWWLLRFSADSWSLIQWTTCRLRLHCTASHLSCDLCCAVWWGTAAWGWTPQTASGSRTSKQGTTESFSHGFRIYSFVLNSSRNKNLDLTGEMHFECDMNLKNQNFFSLFFSLDIVTFSFLCLIFRKEVIYYIYKIRV